MKEFGHNFSVNQTIQNKMFKYLIQIIFDTKKHIFSKCVLFQVLRIGGKKTGVCSRLEDADLNLASSLSHWGCLDRSSLLSRVLM